MKESIGLNFAAALRAFLRQDPNVILVGEIRDFETAEIAIKAALTGHLVLSTLHTNGAPETISRLMNMGIEPFLVATAVHLICAQRLIRRICVECVKKSPHAAAGQDRAGYTPEEAKTVKIFKGKGCAICNGTGYKGRAGLVRSDGSGRRNPRTDSDRRFGSGIEEESHRARHDHAASQRLIKVGGLDHAGRSGT